MLMYIVGMVVAFVVMYREYRGENKEFIMKKDAMGLALSTMASWATVAVWMVITVFFGYLGAQKCYDIHACRDVLNALDKYIGKGNKDDS